MNRPNHKTRVGPKLLAGLLALLLGLGLTDWLLGRLINLRTTSKQIAQYWTMKIEPTPYLMCYHPATRVRYGGGECTINEQSFRHPTLVPPDKDRPRVFIIGGSMANGSGSTSEATTFTGHLRQRFPEVEFIMAGGPSYNSIQQWIHLALNILQLNPDGIIILDGFNDIAIPIGFGEQPRMPYQWSLYKGFLSGRLPTVLATCVRARSNFLRVWMRHKYSNFALTREFEESVFPKIVENYIAASGITYQMCTSRGIKVWHVVQPQLGSKKHRTKIEEKYVFKPFTDAMCAFYPRMVASLRAFAEEQGVPVLDLTAIFDEETQPIYEDYCHINDAGQKIMGEAMADFLEAHGLRDLTL